MRSEAEVAAAPAERPLALAWLRSQGLGVLCGQATVLLLGIGSVVITLTRDGASAKVGMDDLTAFFRHPSPVHAWLYALAAVLGLYAVNTLLCTWDSVLSKWRRGIRELSAYAPAVIHVSFLLALVAHLVGGLWTSEGAPLVLTRAWQPLGDGREARLVDLSIEPLPNGKPKSLEANLEVRDGAGAVRPETIGYNAPLSEGGGAELWLVAQAGRMPSGARLSSGGASCSVGQGGSCALGELEVRLFALHESGHWGNTPVAVLQASGPGGSESLYLLEGQGQRLGSGAEVRFEALEAEPAVVVRHRKAPGNPWALASALVLGAGLVLMGRRWL